MLKFGINLVFLSFVCAWINKNISNVMVSDKSELIFPVDFAMDLYAITC